MPDDPEGAQSPPLAPPFFFPMADDGADTVRAMASARIRAHAAVLSTSQTVDVPFVAAPAALPALLLQTLIVPGGRTDHGTLIRAVAVPWFDIVALLRTDWSIAYQIDAHRWEEIIAGAYKKAGFEEVTLTPRSGDLGRDVIAVKRGVCTVRVIEQVKAYNPDHLVDANDVRALIGVLAGGMDSASKACLSTTSDFAPRITTDPTITRWMPSQLELVNGAQLFARLAEIADQKP
jgi:restriction system protein